MERFHFEPCLFQHPGCLKRNILFCNHSSFSFLPIHLPTSNHTYPQARFTRVMIITSVVIVHFLFNRLIISFVYRPPGWKMTTRPSVGSSQRSELWYALSSIWSSSGWMRPLRRERRRRRFRVRQSLRTSLFHWALLPEANPCEAYFFRERVILICFSPTQPHLTPFGTSLPLRPGWLCQISSPYP